MRQVDKTQALSEHITSDINNIVSKLQLLASERTTMLLRETDADIRKMTLTDSIRLVDDKNILVNTSFEEYRRFIGLDRSDTEYVQEIRKSSRPYVSSGYSGMTGEYYVAIGVSIINEESGEYIGIVSTVFPTIEYFERYGNIFDINSEYLVALDRTGTFLAAPDPESMVGKNFATAAKQEKNNHFYCLQM